jgi:hypothetical protein
MFIFGESQGEGGHGGFSCKKASGEITDRDGNFSSMLGNGRSV